MQGLVMIGKYIKSLVNIYKMVVIFVVYLAACLSVCLHARPAWLACLPGLPGFLSTCATGCLPPCLAVWLACLPDCVCLNDGAEVKCL